MTTTTASPIHITRRIINTRVHGRPTTKLVWDVTYPGGITHTVRTLREI